MSVANIVKVGDPALQARAKPVTNFGSKELDEFIEYLFYTMDHYGGAGLAAPQIGEDKSIFVYGFEKNLRYPEAKPVPRTVVINPEIYLLSDETQAGYEGCLSFPNIRGLVSRASTVRYKSFTREGRSIERLASGFEARIIQHETDHLNGILFPLRMQDLSTFKYSMN